MMNAIFNYLYTAAYLAIKAAALLAAVITACWLLFEIWLQIIIHAIR